MLMLEFYVSLIFDDRKLPSHSICLFFQSLSLLSWDQAVSKTQTKWKISRLFYGDYFRDCLLMSQCEPHHPPLVVSQLIV